MALTVFPEDGDSGTEAAWQALNDALVAQSDYVLEGYTVTDGGSLNADVAAGTGVIGGVVIISDAVQVEAQSNNDDNYIWLDPDGTADDRADRLTSWFCLPCESHHIGRLDLGDQPRARHRERSEHLHQEDIR